MKELFRRYPPHSVAITLYGGCNETYAAVTGDPEGFDKVVGNIRFLQSIGIRIGLTFTMIRQNVLDYPKVASLCRELGIPFSLITDITGHQWNAAFSEARECRLSPAERVCAACCPPEEIAAAMEYAKTLEKELEHFELPKAPEEPLPERADACIGSSTGCAILWNGDMQSCISMNGFRPVKPFEIGFEAAWVQMKAQQKETFRLPDVCQACRMSKDCLHNCSARRFEGTGSPYEPDPYTCQYTYLLSLYRAGIDDTRIQDAPSCS